MSTAPMPPFVKAKSWISEVNLSLWLGVIIIPAFGAVLRFHELGMKPLWFDEGLSLGCAQLSWHDSLLLAAREPVQWPFYLALKFALLFGNSEAVIRLPSALFMTAAIPMLFLAARRIFGDTAALIASTLLAVNAELVKYAQEARSYGLETLLVIASLYFLYTFVERPTRRNQALYVLICVVAVYTHMYGALVILAQGLSLFALSPNEFRRLRWLQTYASIVALTIPMWLFVARIPAREAYFMQPPSLRYTYDVVQHLCGDGGALLVLLYSAIFLASLIAATAIFRSKGRSRESWTALLPVLWTSIPILITVTAHLLGKPSFLERYLLICVPGLLLATAVLIAPLQRPGLILPIVLILAIAGYYGVRNYYDRDYARIPDDYPELAGFIGDNAKADDAIAFYWSRMEIPYRYYMDRLPSRFHRPVTIYPAPGSVEPLRIEPLENSPQFKTEGYPRVWLVVHRLALRRGDAEIRQLTTRFNRDFRLEQVRDFRMWSIALYVRNSSSEPPLAINSSLSESR